MNEEEYQVLLKRIEKGVQVIQSNGGFLNCPDNFINLYEELTLAALSYEIEHDLLPI